MGAQATSTSFLEKLARGSARHPWRVVGAWGLILVVAFVLIATLMGSALTKDGSFSKSTESYRADSLINERVAGSSLAHELVVVRSERLTVDDPAFKTYVGDLYTRVMGLGPDVVQSGVVYTKAPDPSMVSADRHSTVIPLVLADTPAAMESQVDELRQAVHGLGSGDGRFLVTMAGGASINKDWGTIAEHDLRTGELIGLGVALIILVLVFGSVVAATLPLMLSVVSIILAMGLSAVIGQLSPLSFTVTNMITMIGLAVGIDYALFIVSRYREERGHGLRKLDAIGRAGGSASRAVLFSGICVVVALGGLLIVPSTTFQSMSIGAIVVVISTLVAALTLLPAVLSILGDKIDALRVPIIGRRLRHTPGEAAGTSSAHGGFWDRLSRGVMRRPVVSLVASMAVLLAAGSLVFDLHIGASGVESLPKGTASRAGFELLVKDFPNGMLTPVTVAVKGDTAAPAVQDAIGRLTAAVGRDSAFRGPVTAQVTPSGDLTILSFSTAADAQSEAAKQGVQRLRSELIPAAFAGAPATAYVTGGTAQTLEYLTTIDYYTPIVFAFVLSLSFLFLMVVFRSLIVPLKAILMNLLSVGAAYGLMVAVFVKGWGADVLGFQQVPFVEAWIPLFLFAILFGTSMDYHVFLLSRIREHFDESHDNTESVAFGLRTTGGIITGAAVIMVAVFGGFAMGDLAMFQQLGFGLAIAILLDATVVRSILVPAAMKLLGSANWWLPRKLHWLPDLRVEPVVLQTALRPVPVLEHDRRNW